MGNNFSQRRDIYLHQYRNPHVTEKSYKVMIRMGPKGFRPSALPFRHLISDKDAGQYAIITGIYLLFVANENAEEFCPTLRNLFVSEKQPNEDVQHTDDTGTVVILCPASFNGPVEGNDRILYKPRLEYDTLLNYAGLEGVFSQPQADAQTAESLYLASDHPIVHFVKYNEARLKPTTNEMIHHERAGHYELTPEFYARVCDYFALHVKSSLRPTRFDEAEFHVAATPAEDEVCFILEVAYLLIQPGEGKMTHKEIKL